MSTNTFSSSSPGVSEPMNNDPVTPEWLLCSGPVSLLLRGVPKEQLEPFFTPFFEIRAREPGCEVACSVEVTWIAPALWAAEHAELVKRKTRRQVLYASNKPEHHIEGWLLQSDDPFETEVLFEESLVHVFRSERHIKLIATTASDVHPVLRVVIRDVIRKQWEQVGGILLHAAAVSFEGNAILLMGPKGSGKSNLMLRLMQQGAHLLSFDRVIVTEESGVLMVYGWPTYFNVYPETLRRFPDLFPPSECSELYDSPEKELRKLALVVGQLRHLPVTGKARWQRTLFPHFDATRSQFQEMSIDVNELYPRLQKECLSAAPSVADDWHRLIVQDVPAIERRVREMLSQMAASGCCLDWMYGDDFSYPARKVGKEER